MEREELLKNNPNNLEYLYKKLLRNIKSLDNTLTKYLVQDFFKYEDTREKDIIVEIQSINDMTNFILQKIQKNVEENGEEYDNFFIGDTQKILNATNGQFNAWNKMLLIEKELKNKVNIPNISISFNKGYDFGFGISNYCSIRIDYVEIRKNCHHHKTIVSITTTNGNNFRIYKCEEYYKIAKLDLENYRLNVDRELSFNNYNETIEETVTLIQELLNKVGEKYE